MIVNAATSKTKIKQTSDVLTVLFSNTCQKGYIFSFEVTTVQHVAAAVVAVGVQGETYGVRL